MKKPLLTCACTLSLASLGCAGGGATESEPPVISPGVMAPDAASASGPAAAPPAAESSPDEAAQVLRRGAYEFSYFLRDLGRETFTIERVEDGYRVTASLRPNLDKQTPCDGVYLLDEDRRMVSATYTARDGSGIEATYSVEDGMVTAIATKHGEEIGRQQVEIGDSVFTGPHYVTDFWVLHPLGHEVGESKVHQAYAFGFKDWRISPVEMEAKRESNRTVRDANGERRDASVYRCEIRTPTQTFTTRSYLDAEGVSLKITVAAPIGSMAVRITPPDEASG